MKDKINPPYYKITLGGIDYDWWDVARAMNLPNTLFNAGKYFRIKGDTKKRIEDLRKAIRSIEKEIGYLEKEDTHNHTDKWQDAVIQARKEREDAAKQYPITPTEVEYNYFAKLEELEKEMIRLKREADANKVVVLGGNGPFDKDKWNTLADEIMPGPPSPTHTLDFIDGTMTPLPETTDERDHFDNNHDYTIY